MKVQNSFQLDTTNHSLTVTLAPPLLTFYINCHQPERLYKLEIAETDVASAFQGVFDLYRYLYESRDLQGILIILQNGKIRIKKPEISSDDEEQSYQEDEFEFQGRLVSKQEVKVEQDTQNNEGMMTEEPIISELIEENLKRQSKIKLEDPIDEKTPSSSNHPNKSSQCFEVKCITGNQSPSEIQKFQREQHLCYKAIKLLRKGIDTNLLAEKLNVTIVAAKKMVFQFTTKKKIVLPKGPRPQREESVQPQPFNPYVFGAPVPQRQFPPLSDLQDYPNIPVEDTRKPSAQGQVPRLPNQTAQRIRSILLDIVKQGKIQSYEQMQQYLLSLNIDRSLSSIYRYIATIKNSHSEFRDRNFAMHRKDVSEYYNPSEEVQKFTK